MASFNKKVVIGTKEFICREFSASPESPGSFSPDATNRTLTVVLVERDVFCSRGELIAYLAQVHNVDVHAYNSDNGYHNVTFRNAHLVGEISEIEWGSGKGCYSAVFATGRGYAGGF